MLATRHIRLEMELIHWLLLVIAAIALLLAIATALAAADPIAQRLPFQATVLTDPAVFS